MLTPQDIESKVFKVSFKGYNTGEVDDFLQEVVSSFVELYLENKRLKERFNKSTEDTVPLKPVADKAAGEEEASEIIKNAERIAESIIAGAEQKIEEEAYRLESIKREIEIYKSKIVELLNAQLSVIKEYPGSGSFSEELTKPKREEEDTQPLEKIEEDKMIDDGDRPTEELPII